MVPYCCASIGHCLCDCATEPLHLGLAAGGTPASPRHKSFDTVAPVSGIQPQKVLGGPDTVLLFGPQGNPNPKKLAACLAVLRTGRRLLH